MTEEEMRAVAWETVIVRIDDLAALLGSIADAQVSHDPGQLAAVQRALGRLDAARARFHDGIVPRLTPYTGWQSGAARQGG